ncbi:hypothetical protein DPMN_013614 [Dreissena polymorpha]|uniref:Uncharacterized protein n=1 Tax=Dreissena polymorpha TaxID=45954 RepID=A0A9D4N881_DREPO|nr:hypothetical protein DPMN_013614 [Dreissena polymorpha]
MLIELWRDEAAFPINAMYMGFSIGALKGPLVINPFLAVLEFWSDSPVNVSSIEVIPQGGRDFIVIKKIPCPRSFCDYRSLDGDVGAAVFLVSHL